MNYAVVGRLETAFDSRKCTPDGHQIGSIGEVIVAHTLNLTPYPNPSLDHDAAT